jgi:hypothetical protein
MILLAIACVFLAFGFLGARPSARSYVLMCAVALLFSYLAFTR